VTLGIALASHQLPTELRSLGERILEISYKYIDDDIYNTDIDRWRDFKRSLPLRIWIGPGRFCSRERSDLLPGKQLNR
jgi:hypothetical protein